MEIRKATETPMRQANPDWFTGRVWQLPINEAPEPARLRTASVTFEPGARTNWHTHPLGQTLHVIAGVGRIQKEGEPVRTIRPGDSVWIAPGERHWHGAAPDHAMTHVAMQEAQDGSHVEWQEPVSDDDYAAAPEE